MTGLGVAFLGASLVPLTLMAVPAGAATAAPTAPVCGTQHNLDNPTGSSNKVLQKYWFTVSHGGSTFTTCTLFSNIQPGDVVTAHTEPVDDVSVEVTLAVYTGTPGDPHHQTLSACSSFSTVSDTASDPCTAGTEGALTVTVPSCGFQIDLIYGEPLTTLVQGTYAQQDVWITGLARDLSSGTACPGGPTPTPTPTPAGPTPTPTPGSGTQAAVTTPGTGGDPALTATIGSLLLMATGGSAIFAARKVGRNKRK